MPATIAAARWSDDLDIEITQKTPAAPGPGQVQLAVGSAGICGSDLHFYRGQFPARPGITPGHEFAGTVTAVGAGVKHVREGDLVGIEPLLRCGICPFCVSGDYHVCGERGLVGENADGGMSELATVPAETAFKAPRGLDAEAAALAEPLACSVHGFNKVKLRGHETVFIVGAGTIGLTGVLAARACGAKVIVLARHPHQQDAAHRLGATEVVGDDEAGVERMKELARLQAIDVAVETVGGDGRYAPHGAARGPTEGPRRAARRIHQPDGEHQPAVIRPTRNRTGRLHDLRHERRPRRLRHRAGRRRRLRRPRAVAHHPPLRP